MNQPGYPQPEQATGYPYPPGQCQGDQPVPQDPIVSQPAGMGDPGKSQKFVTYDCEIVAALYVRVCVQRLCE